MTKCNGRRKRLRQTTLCHPLCHHYGFARLPEEVIYLIMQHYRAGLHKRMLLAEIKFAYGYIFGLGGKVDASHSADLYVYWCPDRGGYGHAYGDPDQDTEFEEEDPDDGCFDEAHAINCGRFPIAQLMLDEERPKIGPKRGFA